MLGFSYFRVSEHSMEPVFREGDFVVISKLGSLKVGHVVVVENNGRKIIKRISRIDGNRYIMKGDNKGHEKVFTANREDIAGKVFWHIKRKA